MFIFTSISSGLEFWSVNHTSRSENYELTVFENKKPSGEMSSNWPNYLLGTNLYQTLESCW